MEGEIEELPEDMDELVVDEKTERVSGNNLGAKIAKDCFCFANSKS